MEPTPTPSAKKSATKARFAAAAVVAACLAAFVVFALTRSTEAVLDAEPVASTKAKADRSRDIEVFDVGARTRQKAANFRRGQDQKDMYYKGRGGTAHLHLIKPGQVIPLHIHERSVEATVPVVNEPDVTQRFPLEGGVGTKKGHYALGTLIVSPPNCAHEWVNPLVDEYHGSLVFTLGSTFRGNLFVDAGDPRILTAAPPIVLDPHAQFAEFVASSERLRSIEVPVASGAIAAVFVKDAFPVSVPVAPSPESPTLVYVIGGRGRLEGVPSPVVLSETVLVVLHKAPDARVVADHDSPLALYVVRIPEGPPPSVKGFAEGADGPRTDGR